MLDPRDRPCFCPLFATGVIAFLVVLAGCAAVSGPSSTTTTTVAPPREYPDPPDDLTNETAKETALAYEEVYVYQRLRDRGLAHWEVPGWDTPTAEVLAWENGGVYVRVDMPYSGGREPENAGDARTRAQYFVSNDTIRRVNGSEVHLP